MVGQSHNKTLSTLAILKVHSDQLRSDFLDLLIPFIATLIKKENYSIIDEAELRNDFKNEFGLDIPHHALVSILNRCRKQGILNKNKGELSPNHDKLLEFDFSIESEEQKRKQNQFINAFIDHAKSNFGKEYDQKRAENILIEYLKKHDIELLFASENTSLLPQIGSPDKEGLFILADFIQQICENNNQLTEYLLSINIGHLLANTLAYDGFSNYKGKIRQVSVYLDSPIIFKLLGFDGAHEKEIIVELINLIQEQGGEVKIFEITHEEIFETLEAAKYWIHNPDYDPLLASRALRYFKENNKNKSDIEREILNLDSKLNRYDIKRQAISDHQKQPENQIDLEKLEDIILNYYGDYYDENSKGLTHDIKCISNTYHLRNGKEIKSIANSEAIFVSSNYTLAKACNEFERSKSKYRESIPAIVSDIFMGTILWLQKPAIFDKISRNKLIADCYAALKPDRTLVKKYINEIKELEQEGYIKEEESYLLRTSRVALNMLSKETLGDPDNYTAGTARDIYDEMKNEIKEEAKKDFEVEKREHSKTKNELKDAKETEAAVKKIIAGLSGFVSHSVLIILVLLSALGIFNSVKVTPEERSLSLIIFYCVITLFSLIGEFNFLKIRDWVRKKVYNQLERLFKIK